MSKTEGSSYKKSLTNYWKTEARLARVARHKEGKIQWSIGIYTCWALGLTLDRSYILWPGFLLVHQDITRQWCLSSGFLQIRNPYPMQDRSFSAVFCFPSSTHLWVSAWFKGNCKQTFKPVTGVPREACFCFIPGGWGLWPSAFPSLIWPGPYRQESRTEECEPAKAKITKGIHSITLEVFAENNIETCHEKYWPDICSLPCR